MSEHSLQIIARIHNDFPEKFGVPHQSGWLKEQKAQIIFEPEYRRPEAFRGIEEYDYIWLIWQFSEAVEKGWSPTVRPPRLGGNVRKGVLPPDPPFAQIIWGCPASGLKRWSSIQDWEPYFMYRAQTLWMALLFLILNRTFLMWKVIPAQREDLLIRLRGADLP